ncbi:uncharacterized protein N0V89_008394 [Didymosphaeria variabile]|uniref:Uncharacterized protein n=1 Tax=Didymosphaeria variabile TaxID=1932322 RepID=A0A9W9C8H2_9PLEO|nr:uncharacterized protein N0V89_008394 [Didymosphaeria variabile]KAJ4349776.1 hypothetical protein N0V89_008394 [Didymosphaeria variabile]
MGGFSVDNPDPRLRERAKMQLQQDTGSDIERSGLSIETPAKAMTRVESGETAGLSAVPALVDDEKASAGTKNECTSKYDREDSRFRKFIATLNSENAQLAKEKADALQQCADIQKEHLITTAEYVKIHKRWTENNQLRINLDHSVAKRMQEKHAALAMNEKSRIENARLLQVHADLGQENAGLKGENANLVAAVQPLEARIMELQAEVASLRESQKLGDSEREQYRAFKAEREERNALSKNVEGHNEIQREDIDYRRGRSRARSRSPRRTPGRDSWPPSYQENDRGPRYRERSRERSRHRGPDYHTRGSYQTYDQYRPEVDGPPTSPRHRAPSRPARRGPNLPVAREPSRLLTPRETPETHSTTNSKPPHDSPNMGKGIDASDDLRPSSIPTGPKAESLFSMGQAKNKLSKRANKNNRSRRSG